MPFVSGPTHDFIDVRDVVNAILMLSVGSPEALGRVFNISGHKATSNQEVRSVVEKVTGKKANVKLVDSMRPYDNKNWLVDNSDLVRFGWKPQISLEESVKDMVEAYDK
jgi:nucleoside-diphosphate-sugar epimerase